MHVLLLHHARALRVRGREGVRDLTAASISGSERSTRLRKWNNLVPPIKRESKTVHELTKHLDRAPGQTNEKRAFERAAVPVAGVAGAVTMGG